MLFVGPKLKTFLLPSPRVSAGLFFLERTTPFPCAAAEAAVPRGGVLGGGGGELII
tara:strand:- start:397 stop:564 length:168 start_codon:yes stop_codon:yes gene_type:complete